MQRVGALDGIRAMAVAAVVLYHYFPTTAPGGYLGVDVFFVLSGFLITSLLLRERDCDGSVSLKGFWARRARRILPAALTVAAVTCTVALAADPDLRVGLGRQLFGILTFSTNWVQISASDSYFAQSEPQLFLHYWSLAVEEQFYLFWPLVVVGLAALVGRSAIRGHRIAVAMVSGVGAVVSAVLMGLWFDPDVDPSRLYYGTDTHATGLFLGALAAVLTTSTSVSRLASTWPTWRRSAQRARIEHVASLLCLGVLLVAFFTLGDTSPVAYRGGIAAVTAVTAVVVVGAARSDGAVAGGLDHPVLRWIGVRSYSFYLVHWPAFILADAFITDPVTRASGLIPVVALSTTVLLGSACHRWVEVPFLRRRVSLGQLRVLRPGRREASTAPVGQARGALRRRRRVPAPVRVAAVAVIVIAGVALTGVSMVTAPRVSSTQLALEQAQRDREEAARKPPPPPPRQMPAGSAVSVIGDSVALGASEALMAEFPGMTTANIDAEVSRSWLAVPSLVAQRLDSGTLGEALILGIGANGPAGAEYVADVLDRVPPGVLVVVVNAYSTQAVLPSINAGIAEAVAGRPNVEMADWYTAVAAHPDYLAADDVHPADERGRRLYAKVAREAMQRLVARTPATTPAAAPATPQAATLAATSGESTPGPGPGETG